MGGVLAPGQFIAACCEPRSSHPISNAQHTVGLLRRDIGNGNGTVYCHQGWQAMHDRFLTASTPDLGSSGCAVAPADSDNREKCDKSSIVTRAASKALDKTDSPTALGKRAAAGDALKQDGVL